MEDHFQFNVFQIIKWDVKHYRLAFNEILNNN